MPCLFVPNHRPLWDCCLPGNRDTRKHRRAYLVAGNHCPSCGAQPVIIPCHVGIFEPVEGVSPASYATGTLPTYRTRIVYGLMVRFAAPEIIVGHVGQSPVTGSSTRIFSRRTRWFRRCRALYWHRMSSGWLWREGQASRGTAPAEPIVGRMLLSMS